MKQELEGKGVWTQRRRCVSCGVNTLHVEAVRTLLFRVVGWECFDCGAFTPVVLKPEK